MSAVDDLLVADRQELIMQWRRAFGSTPPKHSSIQFLRKVLVHDLQCKVYGDVPKRINKHLKAAARASSPFRAEKEGSEEGRDARCPKAALQPPVLSPGIQLVREWNGRTWRVDVLEDGFVCGGKTYRSLSAIARAITGTRWSGPRFFGLRAS